MRPPYTPEAMALRGEGMRARTAPHVSVAGSYSSTTSVLLATLMKAAPMRPPITYTLPFTAPAVAWLRGGGIRVRLPHLFVAGSDYSALPPAMGGRDGRTDGSPGFGGVVA